MINERLNITVQPHALLNAHHSPRLRYPFLKYSSIVFTRLSAEMCDVWSSATVQ